MSMAQLLKEVDKERLYQHILELEGPNHPIYSPEKLDSAADYISSELERYGLQVSEQIVEIDNHQYRNIEGIIATGENPELLLTAHYDTTPISPGADDNNSAVSVMLEAARILSKAEEPLNVRVIGFTLEEMSPGYIRKTLVAAQELGLMDDNFNFKSFSTKRLRKKYGENIWQGRRNGREFKSSMEMFMDEFKDQMNEIERLYFEGIVEYYNGFTLDTWIGKWFLVGSTYWVEKKSEDIDIAGVINLDTVGYTSQKPNSQTWLSGMSPDMFRTHLVEDLYVGNFLLGCSDINSESLLDTFFSSCKMDGVDLPFAGFHVPLNYTAINEQVPDLLRMDQAPFWKASIPAITLSDTGEFRTPYYHTRADTIDKLDFDFLAKICKASIATAINYSSLE
jgi:hypothetical protein